MFDFDDTDDLFNERNAPVVSISIHRPGDTINEYTTLSMKGDNVDSLYDVLDFFTTALNRLGFTYVDHLHADSAF